MASSEQVKAKAAEAGYELRPHNRNQAGRWRGAGAPWVLVNVEHGTTSFGGTLGEVEEFIASVEQRRREMGREGE